MFMDTVKLAVEVGGTFSVNYCGDGYVCKMAVCPKFQRPGFDCPLRHRIFSDLDALLHLVVNVISEVEMTRGYAFSFEE